MTQAINRQRRYWVLSAAHLLDRNRQTLPPHKRLNELRRPANLARVAGSM